MDNEPKDIQADEGDGVEEPTALPLPAHPPAAEVEDFDPSARSEEPVYVEPSSDVLRDEHLAHAVSAQPSGEQTDLEPAVWNSIPALMSQLQGIEQRVRKLLGDADPKRRRKLAGTCRWTELRDEVLAMRNTARFPDKTLDELDRLITRRNYIFRRLDFLATTRPAWLT